MNEIIEVSNLWILKINIKIIQKTAANSLARNFLNLLIPLINF